MAIQNWKNFLMAYEQAIDELKGHIGTQITNIENTITNKINENNVVINKSIDNKITENNTTILNEVDKNIDVKINENNKQINNTINTKIGDVNVKIDGVKGDVSGLKERVDRHDQRLDYIDGNKIKNMQLFLHTRGETPFYSSTTNSLSNYLKIY